MKHQITLNDVEIAVGDHPSFARRDFNAPDGTPLVLFNYIYGYPALFNEDLTGSRIECRGIIFNKVTGAVFNRPYHKFFNAGEVPGTSLAEIDLSRPHVILEKLDGSMVRPIWFDVDGNVVFGTRMGATDVAAQATEFAKSHPEYAAFCQLCLSTLGCTPIFEWCSLQNRVVIEHPIDRLVLTAMRHLGTGQYMHHKTMTGFAGRAGIECVLAFDLNTEDRTAFGTYVRGLSNMEGFVIRFEDDLEPSMVKVKADEYCLRHKTLGILRSESCILETILDGLLDDAKGRLNASDLARVEGFEAAFYDALSARARECLILINQGRGMARKDYAIQVVGSHGARGALFSLFDQDVTLEKVTDTLLELVKKPGTKNDPDKVRRILGAHDLIWNVGRKVSTGDE
jgi:RNA ligase